MVWWRLGGLREVVFMSTPDKWSAKRRVRVAGFLAVASMAGAACHQAMNRGTEQSAVASVFVERANMARPTDAADPFEALARRDPLAALRQASQECRDLVRDYDCIFLKQEQVQGRLRKEQEIRVRCRVEPFSVFMEWMTNKAKCDRVLYVKGKWRNRKGGDQAWADPAGWAIDLLLGPKGGVLQDIHGGSAKATARRFVDQFGFNSTFDLLLKYCDIARERGELDLTYLGQSELEGRPTYLFRRVSPYTGEDGRYPERLLRVHLDRETHLPIGVLTWADDEKQELLGTYVFRNLELNPGLSDDVFSKEANGF